MYRCWDTDPGMRPTMTEIRGKLEILCMVSILVPDVTLVIL